MNRREAIKAAATSVFGIPNIEVTEITESTKGLLLSLPLDLDVEVDYEHLMKTVKEFIKKIGKPDLEVLVMRGIEAKVIQ